MAGFISLFGSLILILMGDIKSILAAILFTIAELSLARFGHKSLGFSIAASFFIMGNIALITSSNLEGDLYTQLSLWGMCFAWLFSVFKYPVYKMALHKKSEKLENVSNSLPAITGTLNVFFKVPGVIFAYIGGNVILSIAIFAWVVADILAGRLQERVYAMYKYLRANE